MSTIVNKAHPVPPDVAEALRRFGEERRASVDRQNELVELMGTTESEREAVNAVYAELAEGLGVDVERHRSRMLDLRGKRTERVTELDLSVAEPTFGRPPMDSQPRPPARNDADFWWSHTNPFTPDDAHLSSWGSLLPFRAEFKDDGLHISGKITSHSGDLHAFSFGAEAVFGIDWERVPETSLNSWHSSPHIEIFGLIEGWTNIPRWPDGDFWSKCWMHRRQTLIQFGFGGPIIMAEAIETSFLINNEGHGYMVSELPGYLPMPSLVVRDLYPQTLWAHLEVRFDIQLEGDAGLWITPPRDVLLRTFQWPLVAHLPHHSSGSVTGGIGGLAG